MPIEQGKKTYVRFLLKTDENLEVLSIHLNTVTTLALNASCSPLSLDEVVRLTNILSKNITLQTLDLECLTLNPRDIWHVGAVLEKNTTWKNLYLGYNNIASDGALYLSNALEKNITLTRLNLCSNKLDSEGARHLGTALEKNTSLKILNLWDNNIGPKGAQYLGWALINNTTLESLDLGQNNIGSEGTQHIVDAIKIITNRLVSSKLINIDKKDKQACKSLEDACQYQNQNMFHQAQMFGDALNVTRLPCPLVLIIYCYLVQDNPDLPLHKEFNDSFNRAISTQGTLSENNIANASSLTHRVSDVLPSQDECKTTSDNRRMPPGSSIFSTPDPVLIRALAPTSKDNDSVDRADQSVISLDQQYKRGTKRK